MKRANSVQLTNRANRGWNLGKTRGRKRVSVWGSLSLALNKIAPGKHRRWHRALNEEGVFGLSFENLRKNLVREHQAVTVLQEDREERAGAELGGNLRL